MELFANTDTEVDINVIQEQLKEYSYPQHHKIVQLAVTLPVRGSATAERSWAAIHHGTGAIFFFGSPQY